MNLVGGLLATYNTRFLNGLRRRSEFLESASQGAIAICLKVRIYMPRVIRVQYIVLNALWNTIINLDAGLLLNGYYHILHIYQIADGLFIYYMIGCEL